MNMKPPRVATIASDAEVDHAIATLVLAFGTDPVARWMYDDPHQCLDRDMESGKTERVEVAVGQCLLNRRVS